MKKIQYLILFTIANFINNTTFAIEKHTFIKAYESALLVSHIIKKNRFILNSKINLISNSYANKDWNANFTSTSTFDNRLLDNSGDYIDQYTNVNSMSLDKTLLDFGLTDKKYEIAKNNKQIAENNLLLSKQQLFIKTLTGYLNVFNSNKIMKLKVSNVQRLKTAVKASKLKLSAGTITPTSVSEAEARLARAEYELAINKTERANYINEFKSIVGQNFDLSKMSFPNFLYLLPSSFEKAQIRSISNNLKLSNIRLKKRNSVLLKSIQSSKNNPSLDVQFYLKSSESDSSSSTNDFKSYGATFTFKSSLFNNNSQKSLVLSLNNDFKSLIEEEKEILRNIKLQTLNLFNNHINSDINVSAAKKEYDFSKLALNGIKKEEEFGMRTLLDVLDNEVDVMNSEVRLLKSKSDQVLNKYKLLIDIGKYNF